MRLEILKSGHRPIQKIFLRIIGQIMGHVPGPIAVMSYRKEIFGKGLALCFEEAMHGATEWTAGETEIFAAFVSRVNRCAY
jgi:hypothetical protein